MKQNYYCEAVHYWKIYQLGGDEKVNPVIDRQCPLHETAEAVRYLSGGHAMGKVIIEVTSAPVEA